MSDDPVRVMRHDGQMLEVLAPGGACRVPLRPGLEVVPGDLVRLVDGVAVGVEPRSGVLRRRDPEGGEQLLAANVDVVAAVCGLDRPVRAGRLQRTAALAWDAGALPIVVLTKADLVDEAEALAASSAAADAVPGTDVHVVSVADQRGVDDLRRALTAKATVFVGESGAGKSSLVNALVGQHVADTAEVRAGDAKGRHTTTTRQLHELPGGGAVLDSPGIRAVALWVDDDAVDAVFPEVEALAASCRFRDCSHGGEPGCAVVEGVDPARLESWRDLRAEVAALERSEHERRRAGRRGSRMVREVKRFKDR